MFSQTMLDTHRPQTINFVLVIELSPNELFQ